MFFIIGISLSFILVMSHFSFSQTGLQQAELDYKSVNYKMEQRQVLNGVATILSKFIDVNEFAARGFVFMAIRDTQQELKLELKNMATMDPSTKLTFIKTVFNNTGKKMIHSMSMVIISFSQGFYQLPNSMTTMCIIRKRIHGCPVCYAHKENTL